MLLEASSAAEGVRVEVENKQQMVENQKQKLAAVQQLKDLPLEVTTHEQEVLSSVRQTYNRRRLILAMLLPR